MAEQTITEFLDDLTGETGAERVEFSHDGKMFTIDLKGGARANFVKMLAAHESKMEKFLAVAQPVNAPAKATRKAAKAGTGDAAVIRQWAVENGVEVGSRGRINPAVREAFNAANA